MRQRQRTGRVTARKHNHVQAARRPIPIVPGFVPEMTDDWKERMISDATAMFGEWPGVVTVRFYTPDDGWPIIERQWGEAGVAQMREHIAAYPGPIPDLHLTISSRE